MGRWGDGENFSEYAGSDIKSPQESDGPSDEVADDLPRNFKGKLGDFSHWMRGQIAPAREFIPEPVLTMDNQS